MAGITTIIDIILHLDTYLGGIIRDYGTWTYPLLFIIVFCETGLVITPFLPGDSLLFVTGAFAAAGFLDIWPLLAVFCAAAILGDTINYLLGSIVGPKVFSSESSRIFHKHHLIEAQAFYEKHGAKAIVLARFVPIIRTFAPFVAGIGKMEYGKFLAYNIAGGLAWVGLFLGAGYYFGNIPIVKENLTIVIFAIIIVSFIPPARDYLKHRRERRTSGGRA